MTPLAAGIDYCDLNFIGQPGIIACGLLHGASGLAVVDPGPTTSLPALRAALAARGFTTADIRWILITHIHLDHAAATGTLLKECPTARLAARRDTSKIFCGNWNSRSISTPRTNLCWRACISN